VKKIIKVDSQIPRDIRYASSNSFTGVPVYSIAECFLEEVAAQALHAGHQDFIAHGY